MADMADKQAEELAEMSAELSRAKEISTRLEAVGSLAGLLKSLAMNVGWSFVTCNMCVAESSMAVDDAIASNDQEIHEKMEELEAELTRMLCVLHVKKDAILRKAADP